MANDGIDDDISIETRTEWAKAALLGYREAKREDLDDYRDEIVDLIADLLHLCKQEGIEFYAVLESATMHFEAETKG